MTKKVITAKKLGISYKLVNHDALYVIEKLKQHGYNGYIVGGGVRDLILGLLPKDFDIATDATPEIVRKIFRRNAIIIGRRFKIVHVFFERIDPDRLINNRPVMGKHIVEISTYRSSKPLKTAVNQHGKITEDNQYGKQEEDAFRRDFTINALFYDPIAEKVIDYHHGIDDLKHKRLHIIGNAKQRYTEDPVRILRAIRLSVKLGFTIDAASLKAIANYRHLLLHESKGRLYEEMLKILLSGSALACIKRLKELDLPHGVFPLFDKLFFKSKMITIAVKILNKTDVRLKEPANVSAIFILAGLLWHDIDTQWQKLLKHGIAPQQALIESTIKHEDYASAIGISRTTYSAMRSIWLLQLTFANPPLGKNQQEDMPISDYIAQVTRLPRFRQGWHLFTVRCELKQVDDTIHAWWTQFID